MRCSEKRIERQETFCTQLVVRRALSRRQLVDQVSDATLDGAGERLERLRAISRRSSDASVILRDAFEDVFDGQIHALTLALEAA